MTWDLATCFLESPPVLQCSPGSSVSFLRRLARYQTTFITFLPRFTILESPVLEYTFTAPCQRRPLMRRIRRERVKSLVNKRGKPRKTTKSPTSTRANFRISGAEKPTASFAFLSVVGCWESHNAIPPGLFDHETNGWRMGDDNALFDCMPIPQRRTNRTPITSPEPKDTSRESRRRLIVRFCL